MEDNDEKLVGRDVSTREAMEAGPSKIMEESLASNTRLESAQQKYSIFLSHSGAQKPFVRRVRNALVRNAYHPFFDEDPDCLPKGEPFMQHIKDASRLTDVAVVVLSDEFLKSKWPMIELAIFITEQRRRRSLPGCKELKVLPLFMGLSVKEFRNPGRRNSWLNKWKELGTTDIVVSEWEGAVKVLGGHDGLEYWKYKNEEDYIESIVSTIFKLVSPDMKWEDTDVKGKWKLHQAVAEMFAKSPSKTRFHKVRAIGLYGMGGTGKTTICKSLCDDYHVKFNGKVWHAELGKKSAEKIQKDVLHHLVGTSETVLKKFKKSKDSWRGLLRKEIEYKVFLAIDNVWNEDVSREQAEALLDMGFHPDSLVIITSRSRELLEWLGIHKECCYEMPMLDKDDATAVLLQSAAPGYDIQSMRACQSAAVDKVVERCFMTKGPISSAGCEKQYVPLALEVLGRQLRLPLFRDSATQLRKWVDNLDLKWSDQKQHPIFSVLRLSYDNLPSSTHKSIFIDVALCVPRQQDNTSASVSKVCKWLSMVYDQDFDVILRVLDDLERDGLVERWQDMASPIGMHELYCEFVKAEVAKADDFDNQQYLYHEVKELPALMKWVPSKYQNCLSLRRIHIYGGGFRELSSEMLQYMVNVEVLKLDFCFELESLDVRCLKNLRSLELWGCFLLEMVKGLEHLTYLKFFRWNTCRKATGVADFPEALEVVEIYGSKESEVPDIGSFGGCIGLLELTLSRHPLLASISDLCELLKLEKVDLSGCCKVEEVRGLGGLRHLRHLNLENCKELCHCVGSENLVKLETLNLGGCKSLELPEVWDLSRLINLRKINICGILVVQRLVLGSSQLEQLEVMECWDLRTVALPSNFGSWKFLNRLNEQRIEEPIESRQWTVECQSVVDWSSFIVHKILNLSNCHTLECLGDIGLLTSLKYLYLQNCSMLRSLPNLSGSPHLQVVDLSYCCMLEDVGDIGPLRSLQYLYLRNCRLLRTLPDLDSPFLKVLDLSGCSELEDLGNFDSLSSLQMLNLNECVSLCTVPNLSNSPCLEVLNVKGCVELSALSQMSTPYVVIDVSECWSLERIPILNDLARVDLDVAVGDIDGEAVENMELSGAVLRLKLTCRRDSSTSQTSEKVEVWKQHLTEMLRSRHSERLKLGIMEMLEQCLVEMRWRKDSERQGEDLMKEMMPLLMDMLSFEDSETQKQRDMLVRFAEAETRLMGMLLSTGIEIRKQGLTEMFGPKDVETRKQGRMMLRFGNFETWNQGVMEMLSSDETETWIQSHTMLRSRDVETRKRRRMMLSRWYFETWDVESWDVETWKQGLMEMLWSKDIETRKQGLREMLRSTEARKQGLMEMLGFKDVEIRKQGYMEMLRSKDSLWELHLMEMLKSEDVETQKKGLVEVLRSKDVEIRKRGFMVMLRSKEVEAQKRGLMEMLRSGDAETRKQGVLELLWSEDIERLKRGPMLDFMGTFSSNPREIRNLRMLRSEYAGTVKKGLMEVLRIKDVESWKCGLLETLSAEDFIMRKPNLMEMLRSKNVETQKLGILNVLRSKNVEIRKRVHMEMLGSKDVESQKQGLMNMLRSRDAETRKQGFLEMLGSKDADTAKEGLMEMLGSQVAATRKEGLMEMLRFRKLEVWKQTLMEMLEVLVSSQDAIQLGMDGCALANENDLLLIQSCGNDVCHFKNMFGLLDPRKWIERQFLFPQVTNVKFQSISISSASITILPSSNFCSTISRLEIIECRQLRCLSNLYLPALETLEISQCDKLESLPDLSTSTALKHLTIQDFRQGPRFHFLSRLSQPLHTYPKMWKPCSDFKNLVKLNLDYCVGLGGLEHWGPLPALESLVIKDCNTITQLPDLRRSSRLTHVVVMNCGRLRKVVDVGSGEALRVCRVEGCGNEKLSANYISSRIELCLDLENVLRETGVSGELIRWLRRGERDSFHLDMFSGFDFSLVPSTGPSLEKFNLLMKQWTLRLPN